MNLKLSKPADHIPKELRDPEVRLAHWNEAPVPIEPSRQLRPMARTLLEVFLIGSISTVIFLALQLPPAIIVGLVCLGIAVPFYAWQRELQTKAHALASEHSAVPWETQDNGIEKFSVHMDVVVGSAVVGSDRGTLWFENGVLCFAGSQTSFALTGDLIDVWEPTVAEKPLRPFERSVKVPLRPYGRVRNWRVQFDVDPIRGRVVSGLDLKQAIRSVVDPPMSMDLRQLPPLAVGPACFTPAELVQLMLLHLFTVVLVGFGPAGLLLWFLYTVGCPQWVVVALPIIWVAAVGERARHGIWLGFRAMRDLKAFKQKLRTIL